MIFVTVGTARQPFDRLIAAVEEAAAGLPGHEFVIQYGSSRKPDIRRAVATVARAEFEECLEQAQFVVGHAGVGTISASLQHGKRPIVMPRRRGRREMVSDHQVDLAEKLAALGLIVVFDNAAELRRLLEQPISAFQIKPPATNERAVSLTRSFLDGLETERHRR